MSFPHVSASLMAADLTRLGDEIRAMDDAGIDAFHWDIMDGHFVSNLTFGPDTLKALRPVTKTFFDVHLMVTTPADWIDHFAKAGADAITIHHEAEGDILALLAKIKNHGIQAGIAVNPATDIAVVENCLSVIDRIIVMSVNPGFGGQSHLDMSAKIATAAQWRKRHSALDITIDGGINNATSPAAIKAGATTLVSGSALFARKNDYKNAIQELRGAQ